MLHDPHTDERAGRLDQNSIRAHPVYSRTVSLPLVGSSPLRLLPIIALLGVAVSACGLRDSSNGVARLDRLQSNNGWALARMNTDTSGVLQAPRGERYTVRFRADTASFGGQSACNQYGGEYEAAVDGSIQIETLWSTEAYCSNGHDFMLAYQQLVRSASRYRFENEHLILDGPAGHLEFAPNPD